MISKIPGFNILELLYEGKHSNIYRAARELDNTVVVLKILKSEHPTNHQINQLKHEYSVLQLINSPRIIKAIGMEEFKERLFLILENFRAISLFQLLEETDLSLERFLKISIELAQAIGDIHHAQVIHKDIKPHNIIIDPVYDKIKIIDFGISTLLSREVQNIVNPQVLEGTLAYISPEQTGRMNRSIDYRTDIYSLGITLYQMSTGQLPFSSTDSMEMIHMHIAMPPVPPIELNSKLSITLSNIILKCLAKDAEDRYHSAFGLKRDLEECLQEFLLKGTIPQFDVGQHDIYDQFQIPQKLYGREKEIDILLNAFERCSQGQAEILLISGYAGIGKSTLVNEIQKPVVQKHGYFLNSKYDQFKKNVPYSALIQAFQNLIQQLLSTSEEELEFWRHRLLTVFGPNGQLIIDVIPEVELIVGKQPPVAHLDPQNAESRFKFLFMNFIEAFLLPEHPLVIFLDDLQWADIASLQFLQFFMLDNTHKHLLFLGTYRSNEVDAGHPLTLVENNIRKVGGKVSLIELKPLNENSVLRLIQDAFHSVQDITKSLSHIVYQKTQGNPFFVSQFLKILYQDSLLNFDPNTQSWTCDLAKIEKLQVTDNVAELMMMKIHRLDKNTQDLLKIGAAIGNSFDLFTLANVKGISVEQASIDLWPAQKEEMILAQKVGSKKSIFEEEASSVVFFFQHDRIQQAAYQLVPLEERKALHVSIGEALLKQSSDEKIQENVITIVNQLNYGLDLIKDSDWKKSLLNLNKMAGEKALSSAAYSAALQYFSTALQLLPQNAWENQYSLACFLYRNCAVCEFLTGNHAQSEKTFDLIIQHAKTPLEKAETYASKIPLYKVMYNFRKGLESCLLALKLLGIFIPFPASHWYMTKEKIAFKLRLIWLKPNKIKDLPATSDKLTTTISRIYFELMNLSYVASGQLMTLGSMQAIYFLYKQGLTIPLPDSLAMLSGASFIFGSESIQDFKRAYQFGLTACQLSKKYPISKQALEAQAIHYMVTHLWGEPIKKIINVLKELPRPMIEEGAFSIGLSCLSYISLYSFITGDSLEWAHQEIQQSLQEITKYRSLVELYRTTTILQPCLALKGELEDPCDLYPKQLLENPSYSKLLENPAFLNFYGKPWYIFMLYHHERYVDIVPITEQIDAQKDFAPSHPLWIVYYFYYALSLVQICKTSEGKKKYWKTLNALYKRVKSWARACPVNYQHKYLLLAAELAGLQGKKQRAIYLYEQAFLKAEENPYLRENALAAELTAKFYLENGNKRIASAYMQEAFNSYARWGALVKLKMLKEKYGDLLITAPIEALTFESSMTKDLATASTSSSISPPTLTTQSRSSLFDVASIIKASQTLSGEIMLSKLLEKVMHIVIINAGADRAFLIIADDGALVVKAEIHLGQKSPSILENIPLKEKENEMSLPVIHYVERSMKELLLNNATQEGSYILDPYIKTHQIHSILCLPLIQRGKLMGILYLENSLTRNAFTQERVHLLSLLSSQMAISIENALFYANLESKVEERTKELKQMQNQLIQQEKMASLGLLTAGIAHEIKNPLNFVINFSELTLGAMQEIEANLKKHSNAYSSDELQQLNEDIQVVKSNTSTVYEQGKRADSIVRKMLEHSVERPGEFHLTDIHSLLEDAISLSYHGMRVQDPAFNVTIKKDFNLSVNKITIAPQDIHRVILNLLNNAYYSVTQKKKNNDADFVPTIIIRTFQEGKFFHIIIKDNGLGISKKVAEKIFTPFFTTKPTGHGTGLGLSLSHSIITQEHAGTLTFKSVEGEFAEFIVSLPILENLD